MARGSGTPIGILVQAPARGSARMSSGVADTSLERRSRSFQRSFEQASDRVLHILYDDIAAGLSEAFSELHEAGGSQLEVLSRVAEIVGLERFAGDRPLQDADSEALAQRIIWRRSARWTALSLLWTLVEGLPAYSGSPQEWADGALGAARKPKSTSGVPSGDERLALTIAAERLLRWFGEQGGQALMLRDRYVTIRIEGNGLAVREVCPIALVETASEVSDRAVELRRGDRVLLASRKTGFDLEGEGEITDDDIVMMGGDGRIELDSSTRALGVIGSLTLLFEG